MFYKDIPDDFVPTGQDVGCFVEAHGKILLLSWRNDAQRGSAWSIPDGEIKIDAEENPVQAVVRKVWEETGYRAAYTELRFCNTVFLRYLECDIIYHLFRLPLPQPIKVKTNPEEHKTSIWLTPIEALFMPLTGELDKCIREAYGLNDIK